MLLNPRSWSWTYPSSSHMNDAPPESTSPVLQPHNLPPSRAPCSLVSLPHHQSPFSASPSLPGLKCSSASKPRSGPLSSLRARPGPSYLVHPVPGLETPFMC